MIEKSAGGKHTKPEEGAYNTVWAATSDKVESGQFYEPVGKVGQTNEHTTNPELRAYLVQRLHHCEECVQCCYLDG